MIDFLVLPRGRRLIGSGVILILIGAAAIFATIPDPTGVVYGCYHKSNGSLRVIDNTTTSCGANEVLLTWNQKGPAGPAGPSHAYIVRGPQLGEPGIPDLPPDPSGLTGVRVVTLTLPPGSYIIDGKASLRNVTNSPSVVLCDIAWNYEHGDESSVTVPYPWAVISVHDARTFATSTSVSFACQNYGPSTVNVVDTVLRAVLVGALTD